MVGFASSWRRQHALAAAFSVAALATLALLAFHPGSRASGFADLLKDEARRQLLDGIVHGGFVLTLTLLLVCFVFLSQLLGIDRPAVVAGIVAFAVGCGAMTGSMIVDGFVIPSIAARFAAAPTPDGLTMARTILILCTTLIRFLMPMGLMFQAAGMLGWSLALARRQGFARLTSAYGIAMAVLLIGALLVAPTAMAGHVWPAAIVLQAIWYLAVAGFLPKSREPS